MRNRFKTLSIASLSLAALLASGIAAADVKIGTIRADELVSKSPQYKALETKMKADFERRANEMQAEANKLKSDLEQFRKEADTLSPQDRARREKDLNTRQIDFGYKERQFREDVQNRQRELTGEMMDQIKGVIEAVAKEKGLDLVLQDPVYASSNIDVTNEVLNRLGSK